MNKYTSLKILNTSQSSSRDLSLQSPTFRSLSPKSGISLFTMNENQSTSKTTLFSVPSLQLKFPDLTRSHLPSDQHFSDLLDKLDQISSSRVVLTKESTLSEHDELEVNIEEDNFHYIRIQAKGKKNPLKVSIRKIKGNIVVYSSFSMKRPTYSNCDKAFNTKNFEIRSLDSVFMNDFVYLGVKALVQARIRIRVEFGKKFFVHPVVEKVERREGKVRNFKELTQEWIMHLKHFKRGNFDKDFISENFNKRMLSPEELATKNKKWQAKRQQAISNKKKHLEEKKQKALNFINKVKIRETNAKLEQEKKFADTCRKNSIKTLLKLLFFLKTCKKINQIRRRKRIEITSGITKFQKIRKIQRFIKSTQNQQTVSQIALTHALKNLLLYHSFLHHTTSLQSQSKIISSIKESSSTSKPNTKIVSFIESVKKIQQHFRHYLELKAVRLKKIIIFWDQCKGFKKRRSLKKKSMVHDIGVSINQRDFVLKNYYLHCVQTFYENLKESVFISQTFNEPLRKNVKFEYMPSIQTMNQLIENTLSVPNRVLNTQDSINKAL